MSGWRVRGYVKDSDEEEDLDSRETQDSTQLNLASQAAAQDGGTDAAVIPSQKLANSSPPSRRDEGEPAEPARSSIPTGFGTGQRALDGKASTHTTDRVSSQTHGIAEKDKDDELDELQQDWPYIDAGRLRSSPPPRGIPQSQADSHQLSSSPRLSSQQYANTGNDEHATENPAHLLAVVVTPREQKQVPLQTSAGESSRLATVRSLRNRNPIQLHPYLLEQEQYRQSLKARGLRPVNVGRNQSREHHEAQDPKSQDREFVNDDPQLSSQAFSSPPIVESQSKSPTMPPKNLVSNGPTALPSIDWDDEEFPDLSTILARRLDGAVPGTFKRRKTYSRKTDARNTTIKPVQPPAPGVNARTSTGVIADAFEFPPSPPHLHSSPQPMQEPQRDAEFHSPRGFGPAQPPTPLISSETKPRTLMRDEAGHELGDDSPPRGTLRHRRAPATAHVISSSDSESSAESEPSVQIDIQRAKKRIRGVLPASWLRLDQEAQKKRPDKPKESRRRTSSAILRKGPSVVGSRGDSPIVLDDDDTESADNGPSFEALPSGLARGKSAEARQDHWPRQGQNSMDVVEHDWIDPMLPGGVRRKATGPTRKRRQTRLTEILGEPSRKRQRLDEPALHRTSGSRKHGRDGRRPPKTTAKPRVPRLSILDAPSATADQSSKLPPFLRLARRQVRLRPDEGRHSPVQKHIRLQTAVDTEDANAVLRQWRAGTIRPSVTQSDASASRAQGRPLHEPTSKLPPSRGTKRQTRLQPAAMQSTSAVSPQIPSEVRSRQSSPTKLHRSRPQLKKNIYRTAQLEGLEEDFDSRHRAAAFHRKLSTIDRTFSESTRGTTAANPRLSKFLADEDDMARVPRTDQGTASVSTVADGTVNQAKHLPRRKRKSKPRRLDVETRAYRQPSEPLPPETINLAVEESLSPTKPYLDGIGPLGTRYTTDFDVFPLQLGTFFHQSTFIGSGELQDCLQIGSRDLDCSAGAHHFTCNVVTYKWGSWTEDVAAQMRTVFQSSFDRIDGWYQLQPRPIVDKEAATAFADTVKSLRSVAQYFARQLYFLDPIDRRSFAKTMHDLLGTIPNSVLLSAESSSETNLRSTEQRSFELRITLMLCVLAYEICHVARHPSVENTTERQWESMLKRLSKMVVRLILRFGMKDLRAYLEDNRRHAQRELGIRDHQSSIESIVALRWILGSAGLTQCSIWDLISEELRPRVNGSSSALTFERTWYDIFTVLPYQEIDAAGVLKVGRRLTSTQENWSAVNTILARIFELYPESQRQHGLSLNDYFRANLTRCFRLICDWGWRRCDSVILAIFDFFAHRGLSLVQNEDIHGSPRFLEIMDQNLSFEIQSEDRSFHIFLKILAVGLRGLRHVYTDKRIGNIAWRLIPNHGRLYRRDEAIEKEDLDALRNHLDLLCTLYWAAPPGQRPRLRLIQNLVDHTASHREACRLSVRAWSNLAKYQISTGEDTASLEPFAAWFREMIEQNTTQHREARTELERQYESARLQGNESVSQENLEYLISNNQSQILATIRDAVSGMRDAIQTARNPVDAGYLIENSAISEISKLFDPKKTQTNTVIAEVLELLDNFLRISHERNNEGGSARPNDESQDYGDWPDSQEERPTSADTGHDSTLDFLHDQVWHVLSNCFGADVSPDDRLLIKLVDTWTLVAMRTVQRKQKEWGYYLNSYSSWQQLRDTEQTRKYTPYFWAAVVERDASSYIHHHFDFLKIWMLSLVERTSMLKFQHRLTSSLVNTHVEEPILSNLPFLINPKLNCVNIALEEFRERRLNLISTLLANIRDEYEHTMRERPNSLTELRTTYQDLLRTLMSAMKKNYMELQQGPGTEAKGSYVQFVQRVVEFLQQYTLDICPVDKFFTDSSAFPLPVTDKTYVVGRLKGYANKLSDLATIKKLAVFVQTVSERATIDNEQAYLVGQFRSAMCGTFESGTKPTLRQVLLQAVFPSYIELAFSTSSGWIMAKPILHASAYVLDDLAQNFSATDDDSLAAAESIVSTVLDVLYRTAELLITHSGLLDQPHILHILGLVFHTVRATIVTVDYMYRRRKRAHAAIQRLAFFRAFSLFVACTILGNDQFVSPYGAEDPQPVESPFGNVHQFCVQELKQTLDKWEQKGDRYEVVRGSTRREVMVGIGSMEEEKSSVIASIEMLHWALDSELQKENDRRAKARCLPPANIVI